MPDTCKQFLRNLLCNRGVFFARRRGITAAKALFDAAQNELDWPADNSDHPLKQATNISNPRIKTVRETRKMTLCRQHRCSNNLKTIFSATCSKHIQVTRTATMAPWITALNENLLCTLNAATKTLSIKSQNFEGFRSCLQVEQTSSTLTSYEGKT